MVEVEVEVEVFPSYASSTRKALARVTKRQACLRSVYSGRCWGLCQEASLFIYSLK